MCCPVPARNLFCAEGSPWLLTLYQQMAGLGAQCIFVQSCLVVYDRSGREGVAMWLCGEVLIVEGGGRVVLIDLLLPLILVGSRAWLRAMIG